MKRRRDLMDLTVTLPTPHAAQVAIMRNPAKRKVICAGRRFGKTYMAAEEGVARMVGQGRRVVFASTTQDQVDTFWELARSWLDPLIKARLVYKNESKRLMAFNSNGGRIKAKTAWNADTMRGDYGDFIVLDEYAQMAPDVWDYVVAPMMADTDGDTWFISTPVRRNHFFKLYQKAVGDDTGRWQAFHATTYDNPHLSPDAVAELTGDMSETALRQEVLAEFLEGEGAVFRNIDACLHAPFDVDPRTVQGHTIVGGIDWGKSHDHTVMCIFDATTRQELELFRTNKIDYHLQYEFVKDLCELWQVKYLWVEYNSIGTPNFEALDRAGLPVYAFETTGASKPPLIESLVLAFERVEAQWLDIPVATGELEAYERKVSLATGRSSYGAPSGLHDDTVIARALAWHATVNAPQSQLQKVASFGLYTSASGGSSSGNSRPGRKAPDTRRGASNGVYGRGRRAKDGPAG